LWESGNINTQSFKTAEDNKREHKDSKGQVSCNNADKEKQTSKDCGNKEPEWYENLKEHFLEWKKKIQTNVGNLIQFLMKTNIWKPWDQMMLIKRKERMKI